MLTTLLLSTGGAALIVLAGVLRTRAAIRRERARHEVLRRLYRQTLSDRASLEYHARGREVARVDRVS